MKRKSTKVALLTSVICVILCGALVLGGTLAWFNDTETSSGNIIKSGKLDVEMTWSDDYNGTYKDASKGPIFNYNKWEPGYTDVKYIKIENNGSLAFKFALKLLADEQATNGAKLSEVIEVYMGTEKVSSRNDLANLNFVGTLDALMADPDGAAYGVMLPGAGTDKQYTIALHMQESAGNEYQNLSIGAGITVQLVAEQYAWEGDSFDNNYDAISGMPVATVYRAPKYENTPLSWGSYGPWTPTNPDQQLESAYIFSAPDTAETVSSNPYADWICDYYVSIDKNIEAGDLFLGGNYGSFGWIGFENPISVTAGEQVALLGSVTQNPWTYADVVTNVGTFTCGVAHIDSSLTGATFTVELRLTNPDDENDYFAVNTVEYTFPELAATLPAGMPVATVEDATEYENTPIEWNDDFGSTYMPSDLDQQLESVYNFTAPHTVDNIDDCVYKDWICDYYVSLSCPLEDNQLVLGGNYGSFGWIGFDAPGGFAENEEVALLGSVTQNPWTYEMVVTNVGSFLCGVADIDDALSGETFTVKLRLTNPDNSAEFYDVNTITYTFE